MPSVTKLGVNSATTQVKQEGGSILDRIVPVSQVSTGIKLNVYGRGKTGKTRMACTFPKPLLLIGTEDGTKSVSGVKGVDFVRINSSEDFSILTQEAPKSKYKTLVLDTGGGFQDIVLKEVLCLDEVPVAKFRQAGKGEAWGIADKGTWGTVGTRWKEYMYRFMSLADRQGLNIVVIAHERSFGDETSSDISIPYVGAALTPSCASWLNGACDYICQAYIREEVTTESMTVGSGKTAITTSVHKKTGKHEYCLRVGPSSTFMTGFRVPDGTILPDSIVNPDYNKILSLIKGEMVK